MIEVKELIDEREITEQAYNFWDKCLKDTKAHCYFNNNILDFYFFCLKAKKYYRNKIRNIDKKIKNTIKDYYERINKS